MAISDDDLTRGNQGFHQPKLPDFPAMFSRTEEDQVLSWLKDDDFRTPDAGKSQDASVFGGRIPQN